MKQEYDFSRAKRGRIAPAPKGKTRITIRIDDDIVGWFRRQVHEQGGGNYQTLINLALREHVTREDGVLAETLRRVLREEMAIYAAPRASSPAPRLRKRAAR
jgi:hypothetical protein